MTDNSNEKKTSLIKIPSLVTVKKLSELLNLPVSTVIGELMKNGIMASINEEIDFETASIIAQDLGFETKESIEEDQPGTLSLEKVLEICKKEKEAGKKLPSRPPVVTILGHVDHGKTTLLDTIRKSNIASEETGGITQHITAYQVQKNGKTITFIDTPGHEAFSAMRERGASIADIAILVIAADDGIRPQTKEVIEYLKEKKIPTIVAINKIDKPEANPQKVKQELADNGLLLEEWGGNVISNEISAKQNIGIDKLLENILLLAEMEELRADYERSGLAVVLESHLDPQKGPVATMLVKTGKLKEGQNAISKDGWGKIRRIEDYRGKKITTANPSMPVTVFGFNKILKANDIVQIIEKKDISRLRPRVETAGLMQKLKGKIKTSDNEKVKKLAIILKTDVQGSAEAIIQILSTISSEEVALDYISVRVGSITESDVKIAQSTGAIIFGFNTLPTTVAKRMAESLKVEILTFKIIYELVEEVKQRLSALLPVTIERVDLGRLKVLAIFKKGKKDMIVGGRVTQGEVRKGCLVEIKRDEEIVGQGKLINLQHDKINAETVSQGKECGITFEGREKIMEGDTLLFYIEEEKRAKL